MTRTFMEEQSLQLRMGDALKDPLVIHYDGNGWIDENDSIYHRLRIWARDRDGNESLMALGRVGVGAICLKSAETPFALKDSGNQLLGQVRATGVYAEEDGTVGTVQQIDIAC